VFPSDCCALLFSVTSSGNVLDETRSALSFVSFLLTLIAEARGCGADVVSAANGLSSMRPFSASANVSSPLFVVLTTFSFSGLSLNPPLLPSETSGVCFAVSNSTDTASACSAVASFISKIKYEVIIKNIITTAHFTAMLNFIFLESLKLLDISMSPFSLKIYID